MATCKSCNAEIEWVCAAKSGKAMPMDVTRDSRGAVVETPGGNYVVVNGAALPYEAEDATLHRDRRTCHFATCPQAASWRS